MGVTAAGPVVLVSMGLPFNRTRLEVALDNEMADFGKNVIPSYIQHIRVFVHPLRRLLGGRGRHAQILRSQP